MASHSIYNFFGPSFVCTCLYLYIYTLVHLWNSKRGRERERPPFTYKNIQCHLSWGWYSSTMDFGYLRFLQPLSSPIYMLRNLNDILGGIFSIARDQVENHMGGAGEIRKNFMGAEPWIDHNALIYIFRKRKLLFSSSST